MLILFLITTSLSWDQSNHGHRSKTSKIEAIRSEHFKKFKRYYFPGNGYLKKNSHVICISIYRGIVQVVLFETSYRHLSFYIDFFIIFIIVYRDKWRVSTINNMLKAQFLRYCDFYDVITRWTTLTQRLYRITIRILTECISLGYVLKSYLNNWMGSP